MILNITDDWRLVADRIQWRVEYRKVHHNKDSGEAYDRWIIEGWFGDPFAALAYAVRAGVRTIEQEVPAKASESVLWRIYELERSLEGVRAELSPQRLLTRSYDYAGGEGVDTEKQTGRHPGK